MNKITLFFAKASTPQEMVQLSVEEIRDIIRPVGLSPMKSKEFTVFQKFARKTQRKYLEPMKN